MEQPAGIFGHEIGYHCEDLTLAGGDIDKAQESFCKTADFPGRVMLTLHPQRWTDNKFLWVKEFVAQNLKNQVKRWMVKF
jgi:hypothetical protein